EFAYSWVRKVPFSGVPYWIDFAEAEVGKTLGKDQTLPELLKEYYVIYILQWLASLLSRWYVTIIFAPVIAIWISMMAVFVGVLNPLLAIGGVLAFLVLMVLGPAIGMFLTGAVYFVGAKLLGGTGSFEKTLAIVVKSAGANFTLMIPLYFAFATIIGLVLGPLTYVVMIYTLYLTYKGIRHVHGLSQMRAIAVILFPIVAAIALAVILYLAFMGGILGLSMLSKGG
ncbi:MAG: YIP1 family protein, partial [Candidatus Micrarchaeota archaeon]